MSEMLVQHNGDNFRFYRYTPENGEPMDLLSVTSIRNLCGESYTLVNWKMANLADAALGTMKRTVIGPRGGVKEVRQVWEYPSEFAQMYADAAFEPHEEPIEDEEVKVRQSKIDALRRWLREQADEPRNIAAVRGTIVHEAIEKNVAWDRIERPYVEHAFGTLSQKDRKKVKRAVNEDDISFVRNGVRQYWDMRASTPMVILAREVRVVNLEQGYAGTFDALVWLLGTIEGDTFVPLSPAQQAQAQALKGDRVTIADIRRIGGQIVLLDWKTSKGIHTDQVIQAHAYLAAEFAVANNHVDHRITDLLTAAMFGGLVHIRPNGWALHLFAWDDDAIRAFYGSVAFARFLAKYPDPEPMFAATLKGASNEEDEEVAA